MKSERRQPLPPDRSSISPPKSVTVRIYAFPAQSRKSVGSAGAALDGKTARRRAARIAGMLATSGEFRRLWRGVARRRQQERGSR